MVIVSKPAAINFCGNLPDYVLSADSPVEFELYQGAELILEETYFPDASGEIRIDLEDVVEGLLSLQVPALDVPVLNQVNGCKQFRAVIGGSEEIFKVVKGGVDTVSLNTAAFLEGNFLTWQPQVKTVSLADPQWLSYYAAVECKLKARAYLADSSVQTIELASLPAGHLTAVNTTYSRLSAMFPSQPFSIDVWVERAGVAISYNQRYQLSEEIIEYPDVFVFENSLGGIDSINFTGQVERNDNFVFSRGLFDDVNTDYQVDPDQVFSKETGFFRSDRYRKWSLEFFSSLQKLHVSGSILKSIVVPKQSLESVPGDLNGYSFTFAYAKQTKYLQLERSALPEVINEHKKIYYGPALAVPVDEAGIKQLQYSVPDTILQFTIATELTRVVVLVLPSGISLESAYDEMSKETLTGSYKVIRSILMDGTNYSIIALQNGRAYSYNHNHIIKLKNG